MQIYEIKENSNFSYLRNPIIHLDIVLDFFGDIKRNCKQWFCKFFWGGKKMYYGICASRELNGVLILFAGLLV